MLEKQSNNQKKQKGGARVGAGRKKGIANIRTQATQAAAENSGITPLEYMLEVLRNSSDPKERMIAAQAAAPYVHAKLSSVEMTANVTTHEAVIDDLD